MIGLIYFDWKGPRGSISEKGELLKKGCEKTGAKFKEIFGPHNDKWDFAAIVEAEDHAGLLKAFSEAGGMHEKMPHCIFSYVSKAWPRARVKKRVWSHYRLDSYMRTSVTSPFNRR